MPFTHTLFPSAAGGSFRDSLAGLNMILDSRDLRTSGPNWSAAGVGGSALYNQVGLEGVANTATIVGDASTGSPAASVLQNLTLDTGLIYVARMFFKSGTNYPVWWHNPGIWQAVDSKIDYTFAGFNGGAMQVRNVAYGLSQHYSGWFEYCFEFQPTNATPALNIVPASSISNVFGASGSASAQGNVIIGNLELYENLRMEDVVGQLAEFT